MSRLIRHARTVLILGAATALLAGCVIEPARPYYWHCHWGYCR